MDSIERRLLDDAAEISAVAPAELSQRIRHAIKRESLRATPSRPEFSFRRPLAAGLTLGLVALAAGVLWFGNARQPQVTEGMAAVRPELAGYKGAVTRLTGAMDLPVAGEEDLEQELSLLNADLRRIQAGVRGELDPLL